MFHRLAIPTTLLALVLGTPTVQAASGQTAASVTTAHTAVSAPAPVAASPAPQPTIIKDYIPGLAKRREQLAAYSKRHYGTAEWRLTEVKQIVLHYTAGPTYRSAWNTMASTKLFANARGEGPQPFTHFAVDTDGKIYQLAPLTMRSRHVIGLNHMSIGIEIVDMGSVKRIMNRTKQREATLALVRWLQATYNVPTTDVIGHGTANKSRYFKDLVGQRNTHTDWNASEVRAFRALL